MKKVFVVFSFDDGLIDFKENAFPILSKYNYKATINIISGFSDKTIDTKYKYLEPTDISELYKNGFEIANHTDNHIRQGGYFELDVCNKKINNWTSTSNILGIAMPKYVAPNKDALDFIKKNNPPYITYYFKENIAHNFIGKLFWKFASFVKRNPINELSYKAVSFMYKKGKANKFNRIEVGKNVDPNDLYYAIKRVWNNYCVTLCFHSIIENVEEADYPKGAWTPEQFDTFCRLINLDNSINVITQLEACTADEK